MRIESIVKVLVALIAIGAFASNANAAIAIRGGIGGNTFLGNDDGSVGPVGLGFNANFFGTTYNSAFVNNNGNITFDSALSTFTPFALLTTNRVIIAPFFADVDTRPASIADVTYGTGSINGRAAFAVNWIGVGYYNQRTAPVNSFQLVLIDRSDVAAGDFDIEFNYNSILWESGDASGGTGGLGGDSARAGWSNGSTTSYEFVGSAVDGALLDSNPITGLANYSTGAAFDRGVILGQHTFQVRNGEVQTGTVPEPATLTMFGLASLGLGFVSACRRKNA